MSNRKERTGKILFCYFLMLIISLSLCAWNPFSKKGEEIKKETPQKQEVLPKETPATILTETELEQKKLQEKREELNNTEWEIMVVSSPETQNNLWDKDILRFINGEIVSQGFKNMGCSPSRYTIRIRNGKGSWETMQRDENGKTIIFWRGDWENNQMKGMFSIQKEPEKIESYSFQSINKKNIEEAIK
jgi:hypothetical protein